MEAIEQTDLEMADLNIKGETVEQTDLEMADLNIEGETVERHRADERDPEQKLTLAKSSNKEREIDKMMRDTKKYLLFSSYNDWDDREREIEIQRERAKEKDIVHVIG